jgi:hypothetical protein
MAPIARHTLVPDTPRATAKGQGLRGQGSARFFAPVLDLPNRPAPSAAGGGRPSTPSHHTEAFENGSAAAFTHIPHRAPLSPRYRAVSLRNSATTPRRSAATPSRTESNAGNGGRNVIEPSRVTCPPAPLPTITRPGRPRRPTGRRLRLGARQASTPSTPGPPSSSSPAATHQALERPRRPQRPNGRRHAHRHLFHRAVVFHSAYVASSTPSGEGEFTVYISGSTPSSTRDPALRRRCRTRRRLWITSPSVSLRVELGGRWLEVVRSGRDRQLGWRFRRRRCWERED